MPQRFAVLFSFDLLGRNPEQSTTNRNERSLSLSEHEMINVKWRNCKFTVNTARSPTQHVGAVVPYTDELLENLTKSATVSHALKNTLRHRVLVHRRCRSRVLDSVQSSIVTPP